MTSSIRVLIVEDSEDDAMLMVRVLAREGLAIDFRRVETTAALAHALVDEPWDLVLVDWKLPGFDGWEALKLITASGKDIPIIIVSGVIGEETAVAAMKAGAHDFVHKERLARLVPVVERELADAAVRRAKVEAEAALRRSLLELGEANERLQTADRHKDEFLGVISHELRTPIHVLMGFLRLLEKSMGGSPDDAPHGYLSRAKSATEVLARLVNDILDLRQMQAGTFRLRPGAVDVGAVARTAVTTMADLAAQKALRLDLALPPDLPSVWADGDRLTQVFVNLLSNAIKFTPDGGRVSVSLSAEAEALRVTVADTGIGIAPADRSRLFKPFTQLDMGQTRAAGGVGIGLSICAAIVNAHGGRIGVESEPGHGSRFWFSLPLRTPQGEGA
jgi:signal transduction histidine kinase